MLNIDVWNGPKQTFGALGHAAQLLHIPGTVETDAGLHVLYCTVNGLRRMPQPVGPTAFRLLDPGDFNLVLPRNRLKPGDNTIQIGAIDKNGAQTTETVHLQLVLGQRWPLPFEADWQRWNRITDIAEVIDGRWQHDSAGIRTAQVGYDRMIAIGDVNWTDYDVTVPFTLHRIDTSPTATLWPSMGPMVGVQLRFQGHSNWGDILPPRGWEPLGAIAAFKSQCLPDSPRQFRLRLIGGFNQHILADEASPHILAPGDRRFLRCRVRTAGQNQTLFQVKSWHPDQTEPPEWQLSAHRSERVLPSGSLLLIAHHMDVTFGKVVVQPVSAST